MPDSGRWIERVSIGAVWAALGGPPLKRGRGRAFWRDGGAFNVAINEKGGTWHDFAMSEGGGLLDLVERVRGCDRAAAMAWLREFAGVPERTMTPEQRRAWERRRAADKADAEGCQLWALGLRLALERDKARALKACKWAAWMSLCRRLYQLCNASDEQKLKWYRQARERDPRACRAFGRDGRRDQACTEVVASEVVRVLAAAARRDAREDKRERA